MIDPAVELVFAARLFGRLLVRELDAASLAELRAPAVRAALLELDVAVPDDDDLDALAADWFERFLNPTGMSPLVHSLFLEGNYNGAPAANVRRIARAGGLELAPGARGAEPDQLGAILLLWAELAPTHPDLAQRLAADHLAWAERPLLSAARRPGFYADVARAAVRLLGQLQPPSTSTLPTPP